MVQEQAHGRGSILETYRSRLEAGWRADREQEVAIRELDALLSAVKVSPAKAPRGLYLFGPVGRGKSQLMGMFMENAGSLETRRIHMHAFMPELHRRLLKTKTSDPVAAIAKELAGDIQVLGFDEFFVHNLGDGILLGRLFQHLFKHNVSVITTSNWPMDDLFIGGRSRQQLLPYLKLLKENLKAIDLGSGQDYRQGGDPPWPLYVIELPGDRESAHLETLFDEYATGPETPAPGVIQAKRFRGKAGWYRFSDICEQNVGRIQYLDLAQQIETIVIEGVPAFTETDSDRVLRFVTLIDICYELHRRVIVSAVAYPPDLYTKGPIIESYRRAASRLAEMQSWG